MHNHLFEQVQSYLRHLKCQALKAKLKVSAEMEKHSRKALFVLGVFSMIIMPGLAVFFSGNKFSLYLISFIVFGIAIPITYFWSLFLHNYVSGEFPRERELSGEKADRIPRIPLAIGFFERAFTAILIGYDISGSAAFLGAWVTIKAVGGWSNISTGKPYGRAMFFIGLLGSIMSLWFAVITGLCIKKIAAM